MQAYAGMTRKRVPDGQSFRRLVSVALDCLAVLAKTEPLSR